MSEQQQKRLTRKELIKRNKNIAKKRQTRLTIVVIVITVFLVYVSGIYGASLAYFGDFLSSGLVYLQFGEGFPVSAQLSTFKQAKTMGSSLCILNSDSLDFYSPTGAKGFSYYHSMQNPVIAASDNRIAIYNTNQTSLKIANAHKILFSSEMKNDIIHVSMSQNNKVAVTTKSQSYNSEVAVYNYKMEEIFSWQSAKGFIINSFLSPNGNTLAINTVLAQDGYLINDIYIIDAVDKKEKFTIRNVKTMPLGVEYITANQLLVLYIDKAVIYSVQDGTQLGEYSYGSDALIDYDVQNGEVLLALGGYNREKQNRIVMLSPKLEEKFSVTVDEKIIDTEISNSRIYLLGDHNVSEYSLEGKILHQQEAENSNKKLVDFKGSVLISKDKLEKLQKTDIK
ncbi:MAG: DUF5711 family protein [Oscillospiraceae bacterium]